MLLPALTHWKDVDLPSPCFKGNCYLRVQSTTMVMTPGNDSGHLVDDIWTC